MIILSLNSIYLPLLVYKKYSILIDCFSQEFPIDATITSHTMSQLNSHTEMTESHRMRTYILLCVHNVNTHSVWQRQFGVVMAVYERENCVALQVLQDLQESCNKSLLHDLLASIRVFLRDATKIRHSIFRNFVWWPMLKFCILHTIIILKSSNTHNNKKTVMRMFY